MVPGQPFKLNLWRRLASLWSDPDLALLDLLDLGVPLGVNQALTPSSAWPRAEAVPAEATPLVECSSSWKSAQDHLPLVRKLVQEEVDAGFVRLVPGGVAELKARYDRVAIAKLGWSLQRAVPLVWLWTVQFRTSHPTLFFLTTCCSLASAMSWHAHHCPWPLNGSFSSPLTSPKRIVVS